MSKTFERPMSNFDSRKTDYPLIAVGVFVGLALVAGLTAAAISKSWVALVFIVFALIGTAALIFLNLRQSKRSAVSDKNEQLRWETSLPDVQRQDLNIEISELGRILEVDNESMGDLLSAYIVAEDLALRQIQQEEKVPVFRHVSIGKMPFDGVIVKQDLITCVAVTFLVQPEIRQEKIDSMLRKMAAVKQNFAQAKMGARIRFLLVLVTQLSREDEAKLRSSLGGRFSSTAVDIDIRLLDFEALQRTYAVDQ